MSFGKIFVYLQFLIRFRIQLILISIILLFIFELLGSVLNSQVWNVVSLLSLIPLILLAFYWGLFVVYLHLQSKKWLIITIFIVSMVLVFAVQADYSNIILRLIQTLLFIPIIVGWIYLFSLAAMSTPDEPYPTFKKLLKLPKRFNKKS